MPEAVQEGPTQRDVAQQLFVKMVESMVLFTKNVAVLDKNIGVLTQKMEDLTAAIDDHRETSDALTDTMSEATGLMAGAMALVEQLAKLGATEERNLEWSDVHEILQKMGEESEKGVEDEDETEEEA